jgi:hypothetical protein
MSILLPASHILGWLRFVKSAKKTSRNTKTPLMRLPGQVPTPNPETPTPVF